MAINVRNLSNVKRHVVTVEGQNYEIGPGEVKAFRNDYYATQVAAGSSDLVLVDPNVAVPPEYDTNDNTIDSNQHRS